MHSNIFLKGYQWPFDSRRVIGGSSIIDILVYVETVIRGRRVWLDFRANANGYQFDTLDDEARQYLENPEVSVSVFSYNSKVYYVITQGAGMGDGVFRFPVTGNETVLDAVSQ